MSDTPSNPTSAGWRDHPRYPDPSIEALDPRFNQYMIFSAAVERLYTGCRWSEGPVWFGDGRYLLWSDIPNNRILKWEEETGAISVFRSPSNYANGNTRDRQGRLVTCEHGRRVTRTEVGQQFHLAELHLAEFDDASYALQLYYEVLQTKTSRERIRDQALAKIELIKQNRL